MPELNRPRESVWKRLTRLFRSGPVVRHKVQAGEKLYEPRGTASAYKKELSSIYVHSLASYGQYERLARYADYSEMTYTPEIATALNIYADEVCCENENGHVIEVRSKNEEIKEILETLFYEIIDVDFNLWGWVRTTCKNGDFVLFVDANEQNGILNLLPIPINEIEREEGYDREDPFAVRFRWTTHGNAILQNWQVIHFRLLGDDSYLPYGTSILESARRIWRQLILIEDAMLVYRIVRSPERRVFYIDVGNIPPEDVDRHIEAIKTNLKRSQIVDASSGRVDMRYNPLSVDEDFYIPRRGTNDSSRIEPLPGGQFTGDIEDVQYIQGKLFSALGIPKAYLGYEAELGSKATLAQEDVRFAKTIERIQKLVVAELNKIAIIHLYLLGYEGEDLVNFTIETASPSTVATQQRLELWRMKLEIAGLAQEGILDKETIYKRIFGLNDEQIAKINQGRQNDKLLDSTIENITAEAPPAGGEAGAEEEAPVPGEEELPDTLGGDAGGEEPAAPEGGAVNAGFELAGMVLGEEDEVEIDVDDLTEAKPRPQSIPEGPIDAETAEKIWPGCVSNYDLEDNDDQMYVIDGDLWVDNSGREWMKWDPEGKGSWDSYDEDIHGDMQTALDRVVKMSYRHRGWDDFIENEARNPGSTGNRAEIAVDKGKDLFATGEDPFTHAFGTEKQTASDPFDQRARRRMITRPFSESKDPVDEWFDRQIDSIGRRRG